MKTNIAYEIDNKNPQKKKQFIRKMFDSIVPTYDLLNHLLSLGIDKIWRKNIFKIIDPVENKLSIDLCCGTGDMTLLLSNNGANVVSLDFSKEMLLKGIGKKAIQGNPVAADVCAIPFKNDTFFTATIAFGIRNIPDIDVFMDEAHRILLPEGQLILLELVRPDNWFIRIFYSVYLRVILPVIGGVISGKPLAYRYLSKTISTFIDPKNLKRMLEDHGFSEVKLYPQSFNIALIIVCRKKLC